MDYDTPWDDVPFVIEGGALNSYTSTALPEIPHDHHNLMTKSDHSGGYSYSYRYREMLSNAFSNYSHIKESTTKKDASTNFTAIAAIGLAMLCINSFLMRLVFMIVAVILCFEIELQIPAASAILAIFFFRDRNTGPAKSLLILLSLVVIIYYYWSSLFEGYTNIIWWVNVLILLLWGWLVVTSNTKMHAMNPGQSFAAGGQETVADMLSTDFTYM